MARPDFRKLKEDISKLEELDRVSGTIIADEERQSHEVKMACADMLLKSAEASLESVPVSELSQSKAGIRTASLEEAGFTDLKKLDEAKDWEIALVDGVGEKQVGAIRNILTEFKNRLAEYAAIRLSADDQSPENLSMILTLARYRRGRSVRNDYVALAESVHSFAGNVLPRVLIRNGFKWTFSGRAAKDTTEQAISEIASFFASPSYERSLRMIAAYDEALNFDMPSALKDFEENGADYYALMEKLGGTKLSRPLIYSSIPEQLAAEIDNSFLDESVFKGNLRSYQTFGAKYILHQKRTLLGDEMGLGKTVQAIAAMAHIAAHPGGRGLSPDGADTPLAAAGPNSKNLGPEENDRALPAARPYFLVICPASVLVNWCREIKKFSSLDVHLIHGAYLEDSFSRWQREGGAAVTNYESMGKIVRRIDNVMHLDMLIIDEAHYIKNPDAQRTKYIRRLDNESDRILLMTGTPLENRVEEMCSLLDFVRPDMTEKVRQSALMSRVPEFRQMIAPVYLRRVREDVLEELPPISQIEEWCPMTETDAAAYVEKINERNFAAMRRVSFLYERGSWTASAKAQRLLELCREAKEDGRRIVVYSFFRETVQRVTEILGPEVIGTITGSTEISERQNIIDRLKDAPAGSVIAAQIQAGGTGLNIQSASVVIFCEPQIKPSFTNQALSRVYRMGQVRNVLVFHLLCPDTVDEAVMNIMRAKQFEFDNYADESTMAEATENLIDRDWIHRFLEEEHRRYLPAVITQETGGDNNGSN